MERQRAGIADILLKMNKIEGLTQPGFKAHYESHINQTVRGGEQEREPWTHPYGQLISIKGVKLIRWKKGAGTSG